MSETNPSPSNPPYPGNTPVTPGMEMVVYEPPVVTAYNVRVLPKEGEARAGERQGPLGPDFNPFMHIPSIRQERRYSAEVKAMNEEAEIAIFGTRGKTEGYSDPVTSQPLQKPIKGKIDEIRENPKYGKTEGERNAKAKAYKKDIQSLIDNGFEMTQVQLIMDLGEERQTAETNLYKKLVAQYADRLHPIQAANEASRRAITNSFLTGKNDVFIRKMVREQDIFNRAEYNAFRYEGGDESRGETEAFKAYLKQAQAEARAQISNLWRAQDAETMAAKAQRRAAGAAAYERAMGKRPQRPMPPRRPPQRPSPRPETGPDYDEDRLFAGQTNVRYRRDAHGRTQTGLEFTKFASVLDWERYIPTSGMNRAAILHAEDGTKYYLKNNRVYDLTALDRGEYVVWDLGKDEKLAIATIGQPMQLPNSTSFTASILKAEIKYKLAANNAANDEVLEDLEPRGNDPFAAAERLIDALLAGEAPTEEHEAATASVTEGTQEAISRIRRLGRAGMNGMVNLGWALVDELADMKEEAAESAKRKLRQAAYLGLIGVISMAKAGTAVSAEIRDTVNDPYDNTLSERIGQRLVRSGYLAQIGIDHMVAAGQALYQEALENMKRPEGDIVDIEEEDEL